MFSPVFINSFLIFLSFGFGMLITPKIISMGHKLIDGKFFGRNLGFESCKEKSKIPSTGGISFILIFLPLFFEASKTNIIIFSVVMLYGSIGLYDDYLKILKRSYAGMKAKHRFFSELISALLFTILMLAKTNLNTEVFFPFFGYIETNKYFFYALSTFTIVGTANGVNLTDGLDGLAIIPMIISAISLLFAAQYLDINLGSQVSPLLYCFIGVSLSFFWFNSYPAKVFMGDAGSLSGGCLLGCISVCLGMQIFMLMFGALFVVETASVIIQVAYFKKTRGKRIFLMAPIHHHFSKKGILETQVVCRSWIFAAICSLVGCAILSLNV